MLSSPYLKTLPDTNIEHLSPISSSDAGGASACRRRELLFLVAFSLSNLSSLPTFWPFSQSLQLFSLWKNLDGAIPSGDRGTRRSPAILLPLYPLHLISRSIQSELYESTSAPLVQPETALFNLLRIFRSGFLMVLPEALSHCKPWTTRAPPPPSHQLFHPWLRLETSEIYSLVEAVGPSEHALPLEISPAALNKTLGWLEFPLNGLGPCVWQHHPGPIDPRLKYSPKSCGLTIRVLKHTLYNKAQLPFSPRYVNLDLRLNLICLIVEHPVLAGRRLQPHSVATLHNWFGRYQCLMGMLSRVLSEVLDLLKISDYTQPSRTISEWYQQLFDRYAKVSQEESTHRISSTAGDNLGPLLASFPVMLSRTHGIFFFWMKVSFIENLSKFGSYNLLPRFFTLMLCLSMDRSLCSYTESTSLNWLCEYLYQTLIINSSTIISHENLVFLTLCLVPARLNFMEPSSTSQCLLIRTIHHYSDLIVIMALTYIDLVCDFVLHCSSLRVLWIMMSNYLSLVSLFPYGFRLVVPSFVLGKTLSFVIFSST